MLKQGSDPKPRHFQDENMRPSGGNLRLSSRLDEQWSNGTFPPGLRGTDT